MRGKNVLCTLFITTLFAAAIVAMGQVRAAPEITAVSVSPLRTQLPVGEVFSVNVTIANVQKLWAYQVRVNYNTTVLTALNYTNLAYLTYSPFTVLFSSKINDTAGYAAVAYSAPYGDGTGLSTVESKPLVTITFRVDAVGTSVLDIDEVKTRFPDVYADEIPNVRMSDGYFSTEEIKLHDISVTGVTVSSTVGQPGDVISVDVTVKNNGDFSENFTVTIKYNATFGTFTAIGDPRAVTNLALDASTTLSFTWNTAGVADGNYIVRAEATVINESNPVDNVRNSALITVGTGGTGQVPSIFYIAVGILIVIVVVAGVYVLRIRKR